MTDAVVATPAQHGEATTKQNFVLAPLEVVYGDIGTSPLYAVGQSILAFGETGERCHPRHALAHRLG